MDRDPDKDNLSRWLEWAVTNPYHKYIGSKRLPQSLHVPAEWKPRYDVQLSHYPDRKLAGVAAILTAILSAVSLSMGVLVLYLVNDELVRLGLIILLSFLFSGALVIVGVPRKVDSFAATAACMAVLIAFINNGTAGGAVCAR